MSTDERDGGAPSASSAPVRRPPPPHRRARRRGGLLAALAAVLALLAAAPNLLVLALRDRPPCATRSGDRCARPALDDSRAGGDGRTAGAECARDGAALATEIARLGRAASDAPGGRVLPLDLGALDERALLGPRGAAALYALTPGADPAAYRPDAPALVLLHGLDATPAHLQSLVDALAGPGSPLQAHVVCYDSLHRRVTADARDLALEVLALAQRLPRPPRLVIVAHSMGGVVARAALDLLALDGSAPLRWFSRVDLYAIDTPWHGYPGPSDRGADRWLVGASRPFLPDALEDLRARSALFAGDPDADDAWLRPGLYDVALPANVGVVPVFAAEGPAVMDYTEGELARLPSLVAARYAGGAPVDGPPALVNFWRALAGSAPFAAFDAELRGRGAAVDEAAVRDALARAWPRFDGDHRTVLCPHPGSPRDLLTWLRAAIAATGE